MSVLQEFKAKQFYSEEKLLTYVEMCKKHYSQLSPEKYEKQMEITVKVLMTIGADESYARRLVYET
ncbi:TPA: hypothetical protein ACGXMV_004137 [Bacillus pacificus]